MPIPSVSVVVCVHDALEDVKRCLQSIEAAQYAQEITTIIVNDGSGPETSAFLDDYVSSNEGIKLITRKEAQGYTNSANTGLQASDTDVCILLNSDTILSTQALSKIVNVFELAADVGIVGPLSNAASWQSVPNLSNKEGGWSSNPLPKGLDVDGMDKIVDAVDREDFPEIVRTPLLNGFCFAVRRSIVDQIGLFDEVAFGRGYGEEDDYCIRAMDAGIGIAIAVDTFVYHAKSKSFGSSERAKLSAAGQAVLKKKHGEHRLRRAVETMRLNPYLSFVRDAVRLSLEERSDGTEPSTNVSSRSVPKGN